MTMDESQSFCLHKTPFFSDHEANPKDNLDQSTYFESMKALGVDKNIEGDCEI